MMLADLLREIDGVLEVRGRTDVPLRGVAADSRAVEPGTCFVAIRGTAADGHRFLGEARARGAAAALVEAWPDEPGLAGGEPAHAMALVRVADGRLAVAQAAAAWYGRPAERLTLVGVTGTKGKTTTTYLIEAILRAAGRRPGRLGTVDCRFEERRWPATTTTPDPIGLARLLREMADLGAGSAVMEVSSHALDQRRVDGCRFAGAVFTNLSRDHLDYHRTMEAYLAAKARLFRMGAGFAAVNLDDPYGRRLAEVVHGRLIPFARECRPGAAVSAEAVALSASGIEGSFATPAGRVAVRSRLVGEFNVANLLAATSAAVGLGLPAAAIEAGIAALPGVPGRLEPVPNDRGVTVLVDYAHTSDALDKVLEAVNGLARGRVITVFGCGGDRDRGKRPLMGLAAGRASSLVVVTSDNPRSEAPEAIIADIEPGLAGLGLARRVPADLVGDEWAPGVCVVEPDRRAAIRLALRLARPGDVVLIAGKGHEDYQIVGGTKHHFDDREEAAAALALTGAGAGAS
jgi:UDP-N-acetylmuramoyl-L-alanyl-D-glutamate--2,6-diaminopimelate ligase